MHTTPIHRCILIIMNKLQLLLVIDNNVIECILVRVIDPVSTSPLFSVSQQRFIVYVNKGDHGYHNEEMDMKTIFWAFGPDFKKNFFSEPFDSIHIYPLMCKLLQIEPAPHNGSLSVTENLLLPSCEFVFRHFNSHVSGLFSSTFYLSVSNSFNTFSNERKVRVEPGIWNQESEQVNFSELTPNCGHLGQNCSNIKIPIRNKKTFVNTTA